MVRKWIISGAIALTSCNGGPPQDCKVVRHDAPTCIQRFSGQADRELLLGCFPFSKPARITGTWVHGFEINEFYEGQHASPAPINKKIANTELEIDTADRVGPFPKVFQMDFVGRRSQCDMGIPNHIIIVDRIFARREVVQP